jgi:pantetheine-phosphate adenylyltransferase
MSGNIKRLALYPGTFDPITNGHMSLIERAVGLFDEIVVAVAANTGKTPFFSHEERFAMVRDSVAGMDRVRVDSFSNLLADYAQEIEATAIIRGLRALSDFEYEFQMTLMNRKLAHDIETVFLMPALSWVYLSSTIVKEVARHGGDITTLVPGPAAKMIRKKFRG